MIVAVSKPPDPAVAAAVEEAAEATGKPVVLAWKTTLHDAAAEACALVGGALPELGAELRRPPAAGSVRGLYSGGTLCGEAAAIVGSGTFTDFGADEYTQGRAHPMIDPTLRLEHLAGAASDPGVSVLLLDVVLGYGAHPDPAGELAAGDRGRRQARDRGAVRRGRRPPGARRAARAAGGRRRGRHAQQRDRGAAGEGGRRWLSCWDGRWRSRTRASTCSRTSSSASRCASSASSGARPSPAPRRRSRGWRSEADAIARANDEAVTRIEDAQPVLGGRRDRARPAAGDVRAHDPARRAADRVGRHVGPAARRGDRRRGLRGARRATARTRRAKAAAGAFEFGPCHERGAVGPMAGVVSASMPMVRGREPGRRQSRVLHVQRGAREGAALRRQRRRGARAAGLDPRRARARVRPCACGGSASRSTCAR